MKEISNPSKINPNPQVWKTHKIFWTFFQKWYSHQMVAGFLGIPSMVAEIVRKSKKLQLLLGENAHIHCDPSLFETSAELRLCYSLWFNNIGWKAGRPWLAGNFVVCKIELGLYSLVGAPVGLAMLSAWLWCYQLTKISASFGLLVSRTLPKRDKIKNHQKLN